MCQGIVKRYNNAEEPPPVLIYVDRDCCSTSGVPSALRWFQPWECFVRLDIWHFMRRFNPGLNTEHHPLYPIWCSRLSSCIFQWDSTDLNRLKYAKSQELRTSLGYVASDKEVLASLKTAEMVRHCKRTTRGAEVTWCLIQQMLDAMWDLVDSMGTPLVNNSTMSHVWKTQHKHLSCIQDAQGIALYTKVGKLQKGGELLDVYRCARGSKSLESFHRYQCQFIPGKNKNRFL